MKGRLRLGIIGCGWIAGDLITVGRLNPRITFTACADLKRAKAEAAARRAGAPGVFTEYREMLEKTAMDAVYVAVPHALHLSVIRDAVEAGFPVFAEKPLATTLADARTLVELARTAGTKIGINYQYRYDPACYALVRAARSGGLGELHYGRCNIPWSRDESYFSGSAWHASRETAGGGTLITQGSHSLDILLWAMGKRPLSVMGVTRKLKFRDVEVEDFASGIVECEDGPVIEVTSTMAAHPAQRVSIEVYGSRGTGIYTGPEFPRLRFRGVRVRREHLPVWGVHPLARSLEAFRRWVLYDEPYFNEAAEAVPVLSTVLSLYRSAESGRKEAVEPV